MSKMNETNQLRLVYLALALLSFAILFPAGLTWRFAEGVMIFVGPKFVINHYFAVSVELGISFAIYRVIASSQFLVDKSSHWVSIVARRMAIVVAVVFATATFIFRYLELTLDDMITVVLLIIPLAPCFIYVFETVTVLSKTLYNVKRGIKPTISESELLLEKMEKGIAVLIATVLVSSFMLGELRMSHLMQPGTASSELVITDPNGESQRIVERVVPIGRTSSGTLYAEYSGAKIANRKYIIFEHRFDGNNPPIRDEKTTEIFLLSMAGKAIEYVADRFATGE